MSMPQTKSSRLRQILAATFLLFLIVGTVWIVRRHASMNWQENEGPVFGTYYHIRYCSAEDLQPQLTKELGRIDSTLSLFNKVSLLSRINNNSTDQADSLLCKVLTIAQQVSKSTGGAFDITVAPLVKIWGFGPDGVGKTPSASTLDSLRAFVGYDKVRLEGNRVVKSDPRVQIDLGAIAKGYAVDCMAQVLRAHGVEDFMVEIGGEVVCQGNNPDGKPWTVGIVKPTTADATAGMLQNVLTLGTGAMATSGNYLNFHQQGGRRVAHTIDPRTASPVSHNLLSATVVAPDCATADAYATAFMVLGLDGAKSIIQHTSNLGAYLIYADADGTHKVWKTKNLNVSQ